MSLSKRVDATIEKLRMEGVRARNEVLQRTVDTCTEQLTNSMPWLDDIEFESETVVWMTNRRNIRGLIFRIEDLKVLIVKHESGFLYPLVNCSYPACPKSVATEMPLALRARYAEEELIMRVAKVIRASTSGRHVRCSVHADF